MNTATRIIDFGSVGRQIFGDGKEYPQLAYAPLFQPEILIDTLDEDAAAAVTIPGSSNAVTVEMQKLQENGARAASGHKTFSCAQQLVTIEDISGDGKTDATTRIRVSPSSNDGSNTPISVA